MIVLLILFATISFAVYHYFYSLLNLKKSFLAYMLAYTIFAALFIIYALSIREGEFIFKTDQSTGLVAVVFTILFSFTVDVLSTIFEESVNMIDYIRSKNRPRKKIVLKPSEVAFVIPVHNGADHIIKTIESIPAQYSVAAVVNNSIDDSYQKLSKFKEQRANLRVLNITYAQKGKPRAIAAGAIEAKNAGFKYFVLLDDDIIWPKGVQNIFIHNTKAGIHALPVVPKQPKNVMQSWQLFEYSLMCSNKRAQRILGNDVIMASGAAGIYRIDTYLETSLLHNGKQVGDDLQTSFIAHYLKYPIDIVEGIVIRTEVPKTLGAWWKQRTKRWNLSLLFNLPWTLRIIFTTKTLSFWLRLAGLRRVLLVMNTILKVFTLYWTLRYYPQLLLLFVIMHYFAFIVRYVNVTKYFKFKLEKWTPVIILSMVFAFVYRYLIWLSRLYAIPAGIAARYRIRSTIRNVVYDFVDKKKLKAIPEFSKIDPQNRAIFTISFGIIIMLCVASVAFRF